MCRYRIASGGRRENEMHNEKIGKVFKKGLELSVSKSKVLRFKKKGGEIRNGDRREKKLKR